MDLAKGDAQAGWPFHVNPTVLFTPRPQVSQPELQPDSMMGEHLVDWPEAEPEGISSPTLLNLAPQFDKYTQAGLERFGTETLMTAGKYKGKRWVDVFADLDYCTWVASKPNFAFFNQWRSAFVRALLQSHMH